METIQVTQLPLTASEGEFYTSDTTGLTYQFVKKHGTWTWVPVSFSFEPSEEEITLIYG